MLALIKSVNEHWKHNSNTMKVKQFYKIIFLRELDSWSFSAQVFILQLCNMGAISNKP